MERKGAKIMKKIISVILVAVMLLAISASAFAEPYRAASVTPTLSFSGTTANCKVTIRESGKAISATMSLWDGNTCLDSWSGNGTSLLIISGSHEVVQGKTYTLKVTGTSGSTTLVVEPVSGKCG